MNAVEEKNYWENRYKTAQTGWNIGCPSTPIKEYFDQIEDKSLRILIPGAGNAYEAEYLHKQGFTNVFVMDIVPQPLKNLSERVPTFPKENLLCENFFEHQGKYDIIVEQTFFCSFPPLRENRQAYANQMTSLLVEDGKLIGLWFSFPLKGDLINRPFGGTKAEYLTYFEPLFDILIFENCYNSIPPRMGNEFFAIMKNK